MTAANLFNKISSRLHAAVSPASPPPSNANSLRSPSLTPLSPHAPAQQAPTSASGKVYKQGELKKLGGSKGGWKSWHSRWFIMRENGIDYYKSEHDYLAKKAPLGSIMGVRDVRPTVGELAANKEFEFLFVSADRTVTARAKSGKVLQEWLDVWPQLKRNTTHYLASDATWDELLDKHVVISQQNGFLEISSDLDPWDIYQLEGVAGEHKSSFNPPGSFGMDAMLSDDDSKAAAAAAAAAVNEEEWKKMGLGPAKANVDEMLQQLTLPASDIGFRNAFLLHHHCFTTSERILRHLEEVYDQHPGDYPDVKHCLTTKLHILSLIHYWTQSFFVDLVPILPRLKAFLERSAASVADDSELAQLFPRGIFDRLRDEHKKTEQIFADSEKNYQVQLLGDADQRLRRPSQLKLPENVEAVDADIADQQSKNIAQELTVMDWDVLRTMTPREFVNKEWTRKETCAERSANLLHMVDVFNARSYWVASEVLIREHAEQRTHMIKKMINTAHECRQLHNFYSSFAIMNGLSMGAVHRLKTEWLNIPKLSRDRYAELRNILSSNKNFNLYRRTFQEALGKPQIPHLAVMLKDLFQLEEIPTLDKERNVVNFHKFGKEYKIVADIMQCQTLEYHLKEQKQVRTAVQAGLTRILTEEQLWKRSFRFEPKQQSAKLLASPTRSTRASLATNANAQASANAALSSPAASPTAASLPPSTATMKIDASLPILTDSATISSPQSTLSTSSSLSNSSVPSSELSPTRAGTTVTHNGSISSTISLASSDVSSPSASLPSTDATLASTASPSASLTSADASLANAVSVPLPS